MNRWKSVNIFKLLNLANKRLYETQVCLVRHGRDIYVPARPIGFISLTYKLKAIWLVWQGKADVVIWPEDDPDFGAPL